MNKYLSKILFVLILLNFSLLSKGVLKVVSPKDIAIKQDTTGELIGSSPTQIKFNLLKKDSISINVFDKSGNFVDKIFNGMLCSGKHIFIVVTNKMNSGIYYVVVKSKNKIILKKRIVVVK